MAITRMTRLGYMVALGLMGSAAPCFAGFEFSGAAPAPQAQQQAPQMQQEAPMPIIPAIPVTSEPLPAPNSSDAILAAPVSRADETYIRRQRTMTTLSPAPHEAIDTQGLLAATTRGDAVSVASARPVPNVAGERLVINPYPLQNQRESTANTMAMLPVEQAMIEQTGALRPIATPGQNADGMIQRAKISSRYDTSSAYLDRSDTAVMDSSMLAMSITPIPGGEGAPLQQENMLRVPQQYQQPYQAGAAQPVPRAPKSYGGYSEAVGFGRDLPLALALSQIIPPEYKYSFSQNIDAGMSVSWEGGKPWDVVLNEMLAPSGMKAVIENNQVSIRNMNS